MPPPLAVGETVSRKGFITQLIWVINQSSAELERRLGFSGGRLADGWALLLCKEEIHAGEFRFAGYTQLSGGQVGHPSLGTARPNVHDDLQHTLADPSGFSERFAHENMKLSGSHRIVKVVPASDPDPTLSDAESFPPGSGVPQWILTVPKRFLVSAIVRPGVSYGGGGLPTGFWADPALVQTQ